MLELKLAILLLTFLSISINDNEELSHTDMLSACIYFDDKNLYRVVGGGKWHP